MYMYKCLKKIQSPNSLICIQKKYSLKYIINTWKTITELDS